MAICGLAIAGAAHAQTPLPRYDPNTSCAFIGAGQKRCISSEQDAYNGLNRMWDRIPEAYKVACVRRVDPFLNHWPVDKYTKLGECIMQLAHQHEYDNVQPFRP